MIEIQQENILSTADSIIMRMQLYNRWSAKRKIQQNKMVWHLTWRDTNFYQVDYLPIHNFTVLTTKYGKNCIPHFYTIYPYTKTPQTQRDKLKDHRLGSLYTKDACDAEPNNSRQDEHDVTGIVMASSAILLPASAAALFFA